MVATAGSKIKAELFNQNTYVPTLTASTTNPTLGSGSTQSGWWKRIDNMVRGGAFVRFGTSGVAVGSGTYFVSLPFPADSTFMLGSDSNGLGSVVGAVMLRDNSVPTGDVGSCQINAALTGVIMRVGGGLVANGSPWVWAASDALVVEFAYQADPTSF